MSLPEIEFELSALQYELMGYPGLTQGQSLTLTLDAGVLLPESTADSWFTVQQTALPLQLQHVGPAQYAFAGQIVAAELFKQDGADTGVVVVNCGAAPVRVTCGPREDGLLPWGTWETRYLTGFGRLQGIVDEAYATTVGSPIGVTIWRLRRLVLTPGDPVFGHWHETTALAPQPYRYDRIYVTARIHRDSI